MGERLRSVRSIIGTSEERYRRLRDDFEGAGWDRSLKDLSNRTMKLEQTSQEHYEWISLLHGKSAGQYQAQEELQTRVRRLQTQTHRGLGDAEDFALTSSNDLADSMMARIYKSHSTGSLRSLTRGDFTLSSRNSDAQYDCSNGNKKLWDQTDNLDTELCINSLDEADQLQDELLRCTPEMDSIEARG